MHTIAELRVICQSGRKSLEQEDHLARFFYRRLSIYLTWLCLHSSLSANQVTVLRLLVLFVTGLFLAQSTPYYRLAGCVTAQVAVLLDYVDGEVARYRHEDSFTGQYFEYSVDLLSLPWIFLCAAWGVYTETGWTIALMFGATASIGSALSGSMGWFGVRGWEGLHSHKLLLGCRKDPHRCVAAAANAKRAIGDTDYSLPFAYRVLDRYADIATQITGSTRVLAFLLIAAVIDVFIAPLSSWRATLVLLMVLGIAEPLSTVKELIRHVIRRQPDRLILEFLTELDSLVHYSNPSLMGGSQLEAPTGDLEHTREGPSLRGCGAPSGRKDQVP